MPYCSVDDISLYYEDTGSGEPLLLIHGLGSSARDWFEQVDHFKDEYRVLRVDLRGHGRSGRSEGPYHIAQFARDVAVFLRRLDAAPAHVVGLSMGGMVALQLGADAPRLVRSLIVANSVADAELQTWSDVWFYVSRRAAIRILGMRRVGEILASRLFVKPDQEELRRGFVERWSQNDKQAYLWSMDAIMGWSIWDRLSDITAPALVISSDEDYTPVSEKERLVDEMPRAQLAVVEDARHALPVEKPAAFNVIVDDFLRNIQSSPEESAAPVSAHSSPH